MKPYAAPASFLLAVTAAVLGIHYGLQQHAAPVKAATVIVGPDKYVHKKPAVLKQFYVVQRGDSFSVIAAKTHTNVAELERLNPGVSTTALRVGQRIRVK